MPQYKIKILNTNGEEETRLITATNEDYLYNGLIQDKTVKQIRSAAQEINQHESGYFRFSSQRQNKNNQ